MKLAEKVNDLSEKAKTKHDELIKQFIEFIVPHIYDKILNEIYRIANLSEKICTYQINTEELCKIYNKYISDPQKLEFKHINAVLPQIINLIISKLENEKFKVKSKNCDFDSGKVLIINWDEKEEKKSWWKIW